MSAPAFNPFADTDELQLNWSLAEYLEHPAPSRSDLWGLWSAESPYHYRWQQDNEPRGETDAMVLGSAIHLAVLEPELVESRIFVWNKKTMRAFSEHLDVPMPEKSVARAGKLWVAAKAQVDSVGGFILTEAQAVKVHRIAEWVKTRKGIRRLFQAGIPEASLIWMDPDTGVEVKSRPDFIDTENGWVVDVKTTNDLHPWALSKKVRSFGYHAQAALFLDGCQACVDTPIREVYLFWVATEGAPWARLTQVPVGALDEGRRVYREALVAWKKCTESGEWPTPKFERETLPWEEVL